MFDYGCVDLIMYVHMLVCRTLLVRVSLVKGVREREMAVLCRMEQHKILMGVFAKRPERLHSNRDRLNLAKSGSRHRNAEQTSPDTDHNNSARP